MSTVTKRCSQATYVHVNVTDPKGSIQNMATVIILLHGWWRRQFVMVLHAWAHPSPFRVEATWLLSFIGASYILSFHDQSWPNNWTGRIHKLKQMIDLIRYVIPIQLTLESDRCRRSFGPVELEIRTTCSGGDPTDPLYQWSDRSIPSDVRPIHSKKGPNDTF